jgi:DNA-binding NarL/FixJ family response regulator
MIRVAVIDDQPLIRSALRALLDSTDGMTVVAEGADGQQALQIAARDRPDVVVMDVRMPRLDGLQATAQIRDLNPEVQIIVLTTYELDDYVFRAVRAGAAGFFLKDGDADDLIRGIRAVHSGEALMAPTALRTLLNQFATAPRPDEDAALAVASLTDREHDVLRLLAEGQSNTDIAETLFIGLGTVKTHVSSILAKLDVRDRTQAVVTAYRSGMMGTAGP